MSWFLWAGVFLVIGVAFAYLFPETAKSILTWINRARTGFFAIIVLVSAFYFLTTGVWILVLIGGAILVFGVWQFWFDNPFDWV